MKLKMLFGIAVLCSAQFSSAVVIDFESLYQRGDGYYGVGSLYAEDGYQVVGSGAWDNPLRIVEDNAVDSGFIWAGSTGMHHGFIDEVVTLTSLSGSPFTIDSIDLSRLVVQQGSAFGASFTGTTTDGSVLEATFNATQSSTEYAFVTFYFDSLWTDLVSVSWTQDAAIGFHQFDNIVVSASTVVNPPTNVSLPATAALFGLGLFGLGCVRKKRSV